MKLHFLLPVLLLALILFIYAPVLQTPGQLLTSGDGTRFFYPAFLWQRANLTLPLWTEALGGGYPLAAESQMAACYPLQWLFLFLPSAVDAYNLYQVSHLWLADMAMFAFLTVTGATPLPAAVGALAYALGGRLTGLLDHPNQPVVSAWLPLLYACAVGALAGRRRLRAAGALVLGLMLLAGHSQVVLIALLGLVPVTLAYAAPGARLRHALTVLLPLGAVGFALAGIQLVPFAELYAQSVRAGGFAFAAADFTNISLWNLLTLAVPFAFGDNGGCWLAGRYLSELQLYCGMLTLLLALVTVTDGVTRRRSAIRFWWLFALAFLLLAMGGRTPISPLVHQLPVLSSLLIPARYALLCQFALAVLAAAGMTTIMQRPRAVFAAAGVVAGILFAALLAVTLAPGPLARLMQPDTLLTGEELQQTLPRMAGELRTAAVWLAAALAGLWFAEGARRRGQVRFAAGVVLLVLACDLTAYARRMLLPSDAAAHASEPPAARRVWHLPGAPLAQASNMLLPRNVEDFAIYTNLGLQRHERFRALLEAPLPAALALARIDTIVQPVTEQWGAVRYVPDRPLLLLAADTATAYNTLTLPLPAGNQYRLQALCAAQYDSTFAAGAELGSISAVGRRGAVLRYALAADSTVGRLRERATTDVPLPAVRFRSEADFYLRYYGCDLPLTGVRTDEPLDITFQARPGVMLAVAGLAVTGETAATVRHYPAPEFLQWAPLPKVVLPAAWQSAPAALQARQLMAQGDGGFVPLVAGAGGSRSGTATLTQEIDRPEYHAFTVTAADTCLVLRQVAWYSAWSCRIDGEEVPVSVANVMFQGVHVPPGTHRVEFIFRRTAWHAGLLVALLGALATLRLFQRV